MIELNEHHTTCDQHPAAHTVRKMMLIGALCIAAFMALAVESADPPFSSISTDNVTVTQIIINAHNNYRRNASPSARNMLKMVWNKDAAINAASWAATCSESHSPSDKRTIPGFGCGENLYMASYPASWEEAVKGWYSEYNDFQYGVGPKSPGLVTGHYTQVMWYNSYMVGCSVSYCPKSPYKYFYVCQYCPAGNLDSTMSTPYKTGPKCADCPTACDNGLCTNYCPYQDTYSSCSNYTSYCNTFPAIRDGCKATCLCTNNQIV
uniref:Cysteine-rich secretory protein 1 gene 7 n=2 Tax=Xenopus tropicalis TaxID=8364 RepID=A0A803JQP4_XENTR